MGLFDVMSSNNNSSNNKRPVSSSTTTSHHHVHDAGRSNRVSNSTTINNKIASGQTVDTRRFDDSYSTLQVRIIKIFLETHRIKTNNSVILSFLIVIIMLIVFRFF